jgi:hypothetical protein
VPFALAGFLITLLLREIPLRERKKPVATDDAEDLGTTDEAGALETTKARAEG